MIVIFLARKSRIGIDCKLHMSLELNFGSFRGDELEF
jgi:hypothetical protein